MERSTVAVFEALRLEAASMVLKENVFIIYDILMIFPSFDIHRIISDNSIKKTLLPAQRTVFLSSLEMAWL